MQEIQFTQLPKHPGAGIVRVAHTADNHLRYSCHGLKIRGQEFLHAVTTLVSGAAARGASCIACAGDLLDKVENMPDVVEQLFELQAGLIAHSMRMLVIQGNHDKNNASLVDIVQRRSGNGHFGLFLVDEKMMELHGQARRPLRMACEPYAHADAFRERLKSVSLRPEKADAIMWHGAVKEFAGFEQEGMITCDDFATYQDFAAVLLGDIHIPKYFTHPKCGLIGYPGATELVKKDEPLEHGFSLIDFELQKDNTFKVIGVERVPVWYRPVRTYHISTAQELAHVVAEVETWAKKENGRVMLFVQFSSEVGGVRQSLQVAAGQHAIVRASSYDPARPEFGTVATTNAAKPSDYVAEFVKPPALAELAVRLADQPEANLAEELNNYIAACK